MIYSFSDWPFILVPFVVGGVVAWKLFNPKSPLVTVFESTAAGIVASSVGLIWGSSGLFDGAFAALFTSSTAVLWQVLVGRPHPASERFEIPLAFFRRLSLILPIAVFIIGSWWTEKNHSDVFSTPSLAANLAIVALATIQRRYTPGFWFDWIAAFAPVVVMAIGLFLQGPVLWIQAGPIYSIAALAYFILNARKLNGTVVWIGLALNSLVLIGAGFAISYLIMNPIDFHIPR